MGIDLRPTRASRSAAARLFRCFFRQQARTRACPELPRLDGKTALVTGGGAGVGEFVSRGLMRRGAAVVSFSRGVSRGTGPIAAMECVTCDLAEPDSIVSAVDDLAGRTIDLLVCNSGIVLRDHQLTATGLEKTFAVNVFGHHLLYRLLIDREMLATGARIVMTTGDAYVTVRECLSTPQRYKRNRAYSGSKLGNLWQVLELTKRYPSLKAYAVHPGVVLSGFGGLERTGLSGWLMGKLLVTEKQGAEAALIAATQDLPCGAYWHNVLGIMDLPPTDVARDAGRSAALWDELERLAERWL